MNKIVDILTGVIIVAGIMVLVRPGSQGPSLVNSVGSSFSSMIKAATGGGTWA
ncbi:hypothetical protein [Streptomyces sp. NPDC002589]|uniref:hypothetical protein n=1 Tax=unclassified Streptomyces TaxID=2593676 RepID=UPI0033206754